MEDPVLQTEPASVADSGPADVPVAAGRWRSLASRLKPFGLRFKRGSLYYIYGIFRRFRDEDVFVWTGAIAFKVLIAFLPLTILGTGVLGLMWQTLDITQADTFEEVATFFQTFLPQYRSESLILGVEEIARRAGAYTIIGSGAFFILAMSLFSTLHVVIARVFHEVHRQRSLLRQYLFDIRLVIQVGFLFLFSVALTLMISAEAFIGFFDGAPSWLLGFWRYVTTGLSSVLLPVAITTAMFFQLYYFIPRPHPLFRSALIGALFTSVLWEIAKNIFTWYASNLKPFDRYADPDTYIGFAPDPGDLIGIILVLVFWAYYSGVIFVVGAMIATLHDRAAVARKLAAKRTGA